MRVNRRQKQSAIPTVVEESLCANSKKFIGSLVLASHIKHDDMVRYSAVLYLGCDREIIIIFMNVNGITFDLRQFPIFEEEFSLYFYIHKRPEFLKLKYAIEFKSIIFVSCCDEPKERMSFQEANDRTSNNKTPSHFRFNGNIHKT